jgi:O-antigen/teichoic acid export membrane protein
MNLDPARQSEAFRKACVVLLVATVPVCVLQIVLAEPVVKLTFHERWLPATGVIQGLSIGLLGQAMGSLAGALLLARGAFGKLCWTTGVSAASVVAATAVGGALGEQNAVALAVGVGTLCTNLLSGWVALRLLGAGWRQLGMIVRIPLALTILVLAVGACVFHFASSLRPAWCILTVTAASLALYGGAAFFLTPELREIPLTPLFRAGRD